MSCWTRADAALTALPKATALTTYSYRLQHSAQAAFLAALDSASLAAGLADGEALNLDFHAVMHWGEDPAPGKHYVPSRSQRTKSVLTLFGEDAATHTFLYANADLAKASCNQEVIAFADHWKAITGHDPALLIFDSKLTTQDQLAELDDRHIGFITLRARHPSVTAALAAGVRVHDDPATSLSAYPRPIRQLAVTGLGHDQPTLLITNNTALPARKIIQAYARRMNIEQRLAETIRSFSLDALAGAVPLNIDLDVVLSVLAHTICAALRRRLPGYHTATPDTLQRRFLSTSGIIENHGSQITVRLNRRTYSPVLRQASLPETITVPWWGGRTLIRKPECRELLQWEHEWNNQVSSFRAPVERAVATLKTWRILFTDYRRPLKTFMSSFRAAIGLYFFREFCITLNGSDDVLVLQFLGFIGCVLAGAAGCGH